MGTSSPAGVKRSVGRILGRWRRHAPCGSGCPAPSRSTTARGTLTDRGLGSRKARTLLALLASERGAPVPLDRIVETLWVPRRPADPGANVATLVSRTRQAARRRTSWRRTGHAYGLSPRGPWVVDLDEAAQLVREAAARAAAGEPVLAQPPRARRPRPCSAPSRRCPRRTTPTGWLAVRREADDLRRRARRLLAEALTPLEPAEAARVAAEASRPTRTTSKPPAP